MDANTIYNIADSHFRGHLVHPSEAGRGTEYPENVFEEIAEEISETIDQLDHNTPPEAIVYGFIDGFLAVAEDSYTLREDEYIADRKNDGYATFDAAIDQYVSERDDERAWDEAAKGYIRFILTHLKEDPSASAHPVWIEQAKAFVCGAEAAENCGWKVVQDPDENILFTDEDAIDAFSMKQLQASGAASGLLDHISDMLGMDLSDLGDAFEEALPGDGVPSGENTEPTLN